MEQDDDTFDAIIVKLRLNSQLYTSTIFNHKNITYNKLIDMLSLLYNNKIKNYEKEQLKMINDHKNNLQKIVDTTNNKLSEKEALIKSLRDQIEEQKEKIEHFESVYARSQAEVDYHIKEREKDHENCVDRQLYKKVVEENEFNNRKFKDLSLVIEEENKESQSLYDALRSLRTLEYFSHKKENEEQNRIIQSLEFNIEEMNETIEALKNENQRLVEERDKTIQSLEVNINEKNDTIEALESENQRLSREHENCVDRHQYELINCKFNNISRYLETETKNNQDKYNSLALIRAAEHFEHVKQTGEQNKAIQYLNFKIKNMSGIIEGLKIENRHLIQDLDFQSREIQDLNDKIAYIRDIAHNMLGGD